jgi:hypothetical protein
MTGEYEVNIYWSNEDQLFIAEVPELPGWSHKQFRHEDGRATTVPVHAGRDIDPLLLRQIAKDVGLTVREFLAQLD